MGIQAIIVSDHDLATTQIREVLLHEGLECAPSNVLSLDFDADRLAQAHPGLVVLALSPNPERAIAVLGQLQLLAHCPVVAVGPAGDPRLILRALRAGAGDYADEKEVAADLRAMLARLHSEVAAPAESARTIAILAPSGGSGSSTLAVNIAALLAKGHGRALLLDLKLQTGDLAALLDLKPTHTLADLCQNAARMDCTMLERSLVRHNSGVQLLAPPRSFADAALVTPQGVRQALNLARTLFSYVIVDLDHSFGPEQIQALHQADLVLLVLRLEFTCLRHCQRALDYLKELGIPADRIRLVVNRYGQAKEISAAEAEGALNMKIFHYVPEDSRTVNWANNNGIPVVLDSPSAKVSRSLAKLAHSVNGRT